MMSKFPGPPGPLQLIIRVTHSANSLTPVLARDCEIGTQAGTSKVYLRREVESYFTGTLQDHDTPLN